MLIDLNERNWIENPDKLVDIYRSTLPDAEFEFDDSRPFAWRGEACSVADTCSLRLQSKGSWAYRLPARERCCLLVPLVGAIELSRLGKTTSVEPGYAFFLSNPEQVIIAPRATDFHARVCLNWSLELINKVVWKIFSGLTLKELHMAPTIDLSSFSGRTLSALIQAIVLEMRVVSKDSMVMLRLLNEAAIRLIVRCASLNAEQLFFKAETSEPEYVTRAMAFMHQHLHEPLSLSDIGRAAEVNVRTLQKGFKEHRNATPHCVLRALRLTAAHVELSSPENTLSVQEIASKWGFSQMGRFSAYYKASFGTLPSQTARKARKSRYQ